MSTDADTPARKGAAQYQPRIVDGELDELMASLPALLIEGAKGVGKTATASRRAAVVHGLDDPQQRAISRADPARLLSARGTTLIDEWQYVPESWDLVRRAVDAGAAPGSFLLTGSTTPDEPGTHSGAGRIVSVRMRPLALAERAGFTPSVSLRELLTGTRPAVSGRTDRRLEDYAREILASGFPGLRGFEGRPLRTQLDGYLRRIVDRDFPELGHSIRNPVALERWMRAYAAASSTSTSFEKIRDAASAGDTEKPAKSTTIPYRDALERLWILDPVAAWLPSRNRIARLSAPPKHQLVDPALAARLLRINLDGLLKATAVSPPIPRDGTLLGALFESLVTLSVRVYAQAAEASVSHLRTAAGVHEVDLIVERSNGGVLAIEVKLTRDVGEHDTRHLKWLAERIGEELLDAILITTGQEAYRRRDGIAVIPAGLLGP
jgi:predicted AAA+ superfamily ATPase